MKKYIILIILIIFATSCAINAPWIPPSNIDTPEKIRDTIKSIEYVADSSIDLATPQEVFESGVGDCDGMSALLAAFYKYNMGAYSGRISSVRHKRTGIFSSQCKPCIKR